MKRTFLNLRTVRFFSVLIFIVLNLNVFSSSAWAIKYAALVIDAHTGKVLHAHNANDQVPPASLTKMMTLYILFEELEAKRLTLNSTIKVSKNAAKQPPTKLGVAAGGTIRVKDAMLAMITRSANDMSVAIAERISGTETAFVERMNHRARSLGLSRTHFGNTSGLPHKQQVTTATDMAHLSQALLKRFPAYYHYFGTKAFVYNGQKIRNHNKLLDRVEGLDGIKTGFICASGFNIATSVMRKGQRLIGVVMGGETAQSRNQRVTKLLEASFSQLPVQNAIYNKEPEDPSLRHMRQPSENVGLKRKQGDWYVQVGVYKKAKDAHMSAALSLAKLPKEYGPTIFVSKAGLKRAKLYRARLGRFDKISAYKVYHILKKQGVSCLVTRDSPRAKMLTAMAETR